ncbi:MAG TPA: chloride channel protein [Polyangia bacterium]|jgi:CIC family chloride channel protein|nr:chloride channel protein [Polyangia bacterium]
MAAVGLAAGAFGVAFRAGLSFSFAHLFGQRDLLAAFQHLPPLARLLTPAIGGAAAATLGLVAARSGGHGVAEILEAVTLGRGRISLRTALWKALASFLAIVSGGSIGREGPLLQVGAAAGGTIAERFGLTPRRVRTLVAAGTAAGFAAAYNTPIAAVIFVVEIVTGVLTLEVVVPVVVATTIATWLTRLVLGAGPLYGLRAFELRSGSELVAYGVLGLVTGVVGVAFMSALDLGSRFVGRLAAPAPVRGALGGLVVGALALRLPQVTGNGYEAIQQMLDAQYGVALVAILLLTKALATTASVSSGSPGGVFTPSLFLGAATGGLAGALAHAALPTHGFLGGYVLVGMAGVIAATTHAPLMATVLAFELSGDYGIVLPLFIATALATLVARILRPTSIYTEELQRRGVPWERSLEERIATTVRARDIMELDPPTLDRAAPARSALDLLAHTRARVVFVTGGETVTAIDLHAAASLWTAPHDETTADTCERCARAVISGFPDDSLPTLSEKLFAVDWGELPIVDPTQPGRLLGVVSRRTLLAAFDREILQRDLLYTRVVWTNGQVEAADYLELPRGQRVEVIPAPRASVGRPVDVDALRAASHVVVIGVRSPSIGDAWVEPDTIAATTGADRWMVIGMPAAIDGLRHQP